MSIQATYESARQSVGEGLRFPSDLGPTCMVLSFQKYSYGGTFGRADKTRSAHIVLPIPQQIEDQYGININQSDLGAEGAAIVDMGEQGGVNAISDMLNAAESAGRDVAGAVTGGGGAAAGASVAQKARYFSRSAIDGLAPGVGMAIDVVNGTTVNPHTTLKFDGVNLKEFTFNWKLAPKDASESDTLVQIRDKIRRSILPGVEGLTESGGNGSLSRAFLSYPDLVHIYFMGLVEEHYIWFKPAMVKNFNVNFSPQGNVILAGGKPGFVEMSMTVQEAQIHTSGEYNRPASALDANAGGLPVDNTTVSDPVNDAISEAATAENTTSGTPF